jgi:hypothetical protein
MASRAWFTSCEQTVTRRSTRSLCDGCSRLPNFCENLSGCQILLSAVRSSSSATISAQLSQSSPSLLAVGSHGTSSKRMVSGGLL